MNIDVRTADYINRVVNAIADGTITTDELPIGNWCPECDDVIDATYDDNGHIMTRTPDGLTDVVIIGCERYWVIDPNMVGIVSPNWTDAAGNPSTVHHITRVTHGGRADWVRPVAHVVATMPECGWCATPRWATDPNNMCDEHMAEYHAVGWTHPV